MKIIAYTNFLMLSIFLADYEYHSSDYAYEQRYYEHPVTHKVKLLYFRNSWIQVAYRIGLVDDSLN